VFDFGRIYIYQTIVCAGNVEFRITQIIPERM
jgi:hypothetical protein